MVKNPYLSTKTTKAVSTGTSTTTTTATRDVAPTAKTTTAPTGPSFHSSSTVPSTHYHPDDDLVPPLPQQQYTTFSQAFGDAATDDDYHPENDNENHPTTTDVVTMDPTTTTTANQEHPTNTTTGSTSSSTTALFNNDRDYHVLQQQPHVLYVSTKQHGNPILQYIRNVPFTYTRMVPDYIFSTTSCAIYLSCKYHILYRNYIHTRIAALKTDFTCRILLLYMDTDDTDAILHELNVLCVTHNFTLILGWSEMEMARYLETFKALQHRDAATIQKSRDGRNSSNIVDQMMEILLSSSGGSHGTKLNRTDAATVLTQFPTWQQLTHATPDQLSLVAGLGPTKVQRLYDAFHQPFSTKLSRARQRKQQHQPEQPPEPQSANNET